MDELDAIAARVVGRDPDGARGPWTLELYPTLVCNLSCRFCDTTLRHQRPSGELSAARMLALVDEAAAMGARRVMVLGGGEPLIAPHTIDVMRRVKARGLWGSLTTNGTLMGPAVRAALVEMAWDEVHISIDGARARTHDHLRGHAGAFARTVRNVCALRAARDRAQSGPRLSLHTVLTRDNVDELDALIHLAHALGADAVELDALVAYRPEQLAFALGPEDESRLGERLRAGIAVAERLGIRTTYARFLDPGARARGELLPPAPVVAGDAPDFARAPCLKAWHHLTVAADGRVAACCVLAGEGGSVAETSLASVWQTDPFLQTLRAGMLQGRPTGRCVECSENLLVHERAISARLPMALA